MSDYLRYCSHDGLYADYHSHRHRFVSGFVGAGVTPKIAQILARHSDVRLTLGTYAHVELQDQTNAIAAMPGPPGDGAMRVAGMET